MPTFRVCTWKTIYEMSDINAATPDAARKIAEQSLTGDREDVTWKTFCTEGGRVESVELV